MSKSKKRIPLAADGTKIYAPKKIISGYQTYVVENTVQNELSDKEKEISADLVRSFNIINKK